MVRNKFAFYYSPDQIDAGYSAVAEGDTLQIYLTKHDANTLYAFADTIAGRAMLEAIQPGDHSTAFDDLIEHTSKAVRHISEVVGGLMVVCVKRYVGATLYDLGAQIIQIEGVPDSQRVAIPFFIDIPSAAHENA